MLKFIWRYPTRFWFVVLEVITVLLLVTFVNVPTKQMVIFCVFVSIPLWVFAKIIKFCMISWANYTCPFKPREIMNWLMYIEDRLPAQSKTLGWESMLDIALETNANFLGQRILICCWLLLLPSRNVRVNAGYRKKRKTIFVSTRRLSIP